MDTHPSPNAFFTGQNVRAFGCLHRFAQAIGEFLVKPYAVGFVHC